MIMWYRSSQVPRILRPLPNKDNGCVRGATGMASFRLRTRSIHPNLALRLEKALSESFWSSGGRCGGIRIDCSQRLLLRLPPRVLFHLVSADQVERQGQTKIRRRFQGRCVSIPVSKRLGMAFLCILVVDLYQTPNPIA